MLTVEGLCAGYGRLNILHEISLTVGAGEIVALVGANGAGKTTALRAVSGLIRPTRGAVRFDGAAVHTARPDRIVRAGLVQVAEERRLFGPLTVLENLQMGAYARPAGERAARLDEVFELFPILAERRRQIAETMSGGQQQMLAIGRALMSRPRLLMLDEPSIGLAPKLVQAVLDAVRRIRDTGVPVLLVEQNAAQALAVSDRAYVLESGTIALSGTGEELLHDDRVRQTYLGL
ncbi:branched-chain amino acid transport system ATP-binding protein [Spinactinospora alkalitolerans]|uniref:Branched-chain amino acid transport system ATP-binding protein n=1 Tax=Spinactinospora alkalitolerans TaxID=687207 RepID=A0A852TNP4_9ACTN|nr:ABC transporter ATP-binding protein [Spinactinospora alkalitolerans]NYE45976.1 branched-chain amino acid transport system ATP-binding protein [Spinactinospora alkalitolerans]